MNHIFHYHVTGFLALRAGFSRSEAQILAASAQYVDHALLPLSVELPGSAADYRIPVTHHFGFWSPEQERSVWMPFHFFPGAREDSCRRDGQRSAWRVVPRGQPVKELLVAALKTRDLYRVGIALHTFADSWAHQEFIGRIDEFNRLPGVVGIPPLGHAQAESLPDLIQVAWTDARLENSTADNRGRFLEAARSIYRYLAAFQHRDGQDLELVMTELEILLGGEYPPVPYDSAISRLQEGLKTGMAALGRLGRRLADPVVPEAPPSADSPRPELRGDPDRMIASRLQAATGLPDYERQAWRREALFLDGTEDIDDETAGLNDKLSWIKHEIMSRAGYPQTRLRARPGFENSSLFRWSEAARAHAGEAGRIIGQI